MTRGQRNSTGRKSLVQQGDDKDVCAELQEHSRNATSVVSSASFLCPSLNSDSSLHAGSGPWTLPNTDNCVGHSKHPGKNVSKTRISYRLSSWRGAACGKRGDYLLKKGQRGAL
jgi:hypothetical protein